MAGDNTLSHRMADVARAQPQWYELLGQLVEEIGSTGFPDALEDVLHHVIAFKHTVTFAYNGAAVPLCLDHSFPPPRYAIHVTDYQSGPYFLDPLYKASLNGVRSGVFRLKDVAPDQFYKSEYYRSYYVQTGPVDEVAFFIGCNENWTVVTSLMRPHSDTQFSTRELQHLSCIEPLLGAACRRHWQGDSRLKAAKHAETEQEALRRTIREALVRLDIPPLTTRETEVVGLVLQGHSSESIANILKIATGTVRIHRKNIYAKMRISSQRELFAAFINPSRP